MVWVSPVSHWEARQPQQSGCYWLRFSSFLGKLTYFYIPARKFGLYHFHKLVDIEEIAEQLLYKNTRGEGRRSQGAAGFKGCRTAVTLSCPLCPANVLPTLRPNGPAPTSGLSVSCVSSQNLSRS